MSERLRGKVVRLTLRRLRSGMLSFDARIEFDADQFPWLSVRLRGHVAAAGWDVRLLRGFQERYDVPELPEPKWVAS